jgi:hypothetical protein
MIKNTDTALTPCPAPTGRAGHGSVDCGVTRGAGAGQRGAAGAGVAAAGPSTATASNDIQFCSSAPLSCRTAQNDRTHRPGSSVLLCRS